MSQSSRSQGENIPFSAMDTVDWKLKVKFWKPVTAQCGWIQVVTTLCRFQYGVAKCCCSFSELFALNGRCDLEWGLVP